MTPHNETPIKASWIKLLRCPHTNDGLLLANESILDDVNRRIRNGEALDQVGNKVTRLLDAALVNQRISFLYPVRDGVPILLKDDAITIDAERKLDARTGESS